MKTVRFIAMTEEEAHILRTELINAAFPWWSHEESMQLPIMKELHAEIAKNSEFQPRLRAPNLERIGDMYCIPLEPVT